MRTQRTWFPGFALLAQALLGVAFGQDGDAASAPRRTTITPEVVDFGDVWQGAALEADIKITNGGETPTTALVRTSSCDGQRYEIGVGASEVAHVTYTVGRSGPFDHRVLIDDCGGGAPLSVTLRGNVKPLWVAVPEAVDLGVLPPDAGAGRTERLETVADPSFEFVAEGDPAYPWLRVSLNEQAASNAYDLTVFVVPPLPEGAVRAQVVLRPNRPGLPPYVIPIRGRVVPYVDVAPAKLFAPRTPRDLRLVTSLWCHHGAQARVKRATTDVPGATCTIGLLEPTEANGVSRQSIEIWIPGATHVPEGAHLVIETEAIAAQQRRFEVPIYGRVPSSQPGD